MIETICTCACVRRGLPSYKGAAMERSRVLAQKETALQHEISVSWSQEVVPEQWQCMGFDAPEEQSWGKGRNSLGRSASSSGLGRTFVW